MTCECHFSVYSPFYRKSKYYLYFSKSILSAFVSCSVSRLTKRTKEFNLFSRSHLKDYYSLLLVSLCFVHISNILSLFCLFFSLSTSARDNLVFLERWFLKFPHYLNRSLFITGESYAGNNFIFVPFLSIIVLVANVLMQM